MRWILRFGKWILPCLTAAVLSSCEKDAQKASGDAPGPGAPKPPSPRNLSVDEAENLVREETRLTVLDVRTPAEYAAGHIKGAQNIDFNAAGFKDKVAALDRTKPYLVHCTAGGRSAKAVDVLKGLDFRSIYHLSDGMNGWLKAGKPVEK